MNIINKKQLPKKSYAYIVVTCNPHLYYNWGGLLNWRTATAEDYQRALEDSCKPFHSNKHKPRDPAINGAICVVEISEDGTIHVHHVFFSKSRISFESLQKAYPRSHIERACGDAESNWNYIFKQGNAVNEAKKHTQLCVPYVWGEWFLTDQDIYGKDKGFNAGSIMDQIKAMLDDGMTPEEIYNLGPKYSYYHNAIEYTYYARVNSAIPLRREDKLVYWHVGPSGSGKTEVWDTLIAGPDGSQICKLDSGPNMFDSYDYSPILVLDDIKGDNYSVWKADVKLVHMLQILDKRICTLPCRYHDKKCNAAEVHVTSIFPPESVYHFVGLDAFEQLRRRLTHVVYHWKDEQGNYRKFELSAKDYKDYADLKAKALENGGELVPWHEH